jgi:nitrite reductase/ring-hydroxylating ferredoxin subunit
MTAFGPPARARQWLGFIGPIELARSKERHVTEYRYLLAGDELDICPTAIPEDRLVGQRIDGFWCVLGRSGAQLFAYREICPGCGSSLVQSPVTAGVVTCSVCRVQYDLTRGGRSLDMEVRGMRSAPLDSYSGIWEGATLRPSR